MSIRLMSAVFENQELSATEKLIMLALADHANDEGKSVYPSQGTVSRKTGLTRETINRHVSDLIERNYLIKVGYKEDRANVLELEINIELLVGCDLESQVGVINDHRGCDLESQVGVINDHTNHHVNHQLSANETIKQAATPRAPHSDVDELMMWIKPDPLKEMINVAENYPPKIRDVLVPFVKHWKIKPPLVSQKGLSGKWLKGGKLVHQVLSDAELLSKIDQIMADMYEYWKTPPEWSKKSRDQYEGKFVVTDIYSIVKLTNQAASAWVMGEKLSKKRTQTYYDADGNPVEMEI